MMAPIDRLMNMPCEEIGCSRDKCPGDYLFCHFHRNLWRIWIKKMGIEDLSVSDHELRGTHLVRFMSR